MNERTIACFSMEIALDSAMSTHAGGLGVLAGDTIRSAAELKMPLVAVSLLHRKGFLSERLDASGWQYEEPAEWAVETLPNELPESDAASLYDKLERVVLPLFHHNRGGFVDVMHHCISLNGSFFNTQRMVQQYVVKAYLA